MRQPFITGVDLLRQRITAKEQVPEDSPVAGMPPYMESFLAHVRMLVGVPFEYLIPHPDLLPDESIRFFYLDRSWADRMVDGSNAVGQIGSREQAHYHAHAPNVSQQLDISERMVRLLQRKTDFDTAKQTVSGGGPAGVVTGLILRSAAVAGWPGMDVRAYKTDIQEPLDTSAPASTAAQLNPLRIERIAPSVLIALFDGEPSLVILEEPHHGIRFGVRADGANLTVPLRDAFGTSLTRNQNALTIPVPRRLNNSSVVRVLALRNALEANKTPNPASNPPVAIEQTGSAAFAISVLDPPWRQRFEGTVDHAGDPPPNRGFLFVSQIVQQFDLRATVTQVLGEH
jgi:hypothetical protein